MVLLSGRARLVRPPARLPRRRGRIGDRWESTVSDGPPVKLRPCAAEADDKNFDVVEVRRPHGDLRRYLATPRFTTTEAWKGWLSLMGQMRPAFLYPARRPTQGSPPTAFNARARRSGASLSTRTGAVEVVQGACEFTPVAAQRYPRPTTTWAHHRRPHHAAWSRATREQLAWPMRSVRSAGRHGGPPGHHGSGTGWWIFHVGWKNTHKEKRRSGAMVVVIIGRLRGRLPTGQPHASDAATFAYLFAPPGHGGTAVGSPRANNWASGLGGATTGGRP